MTGSDVVFDAWAWWEVVGGTPLGTRLHRRYLRSPRVRVHTSALAVGEVCAKLRSQGGADRAERFVPLAVAHSEVHDVTLRQCVAGARLREEMRRLAPRASLADGIMAALAAELRARLITGDAAFRGRRAKAA